MVTPVSLWACALGRTHSITWRPLHRQGNEKLRHGTIMSGLKNKLKTGVPNWGRHTVPAPAVLDQRAGKAGKEQLGTLPLPEMGLTFTPEPDGVMLEL
ncbi:hypothetical protein GCM10009838_11910 [Catenulispora subtropica]|uniref:Uncharacterized protein n=1 Tax=Catenulispora subtropica TaxID=450798 RepID=A0ABP5C7H7_9ACTN